MASVRCLQARQGLVGCGSWFHSAESWPNHTPSDCTSTCTAKYPLTSTGYATTGALVNLLVHLSAPVLLFISIGYAIFSELHQCTSIRRTFKPLYRAIYSPHIAPISPYTLPSLMYVFCVIYWCTGVIVFFGMFINKLRCTSSAPLYTSMFVIPGLSRL